MFADTEGDSFKDNRRFQIEIFLIFRLTRHREWIERSKQTGKGEKVNKLPEEQPALEVIKIIESALRFDLPV